MRRPWSIRWWLGGLVIGVALPLLVIVVLLFTVQLRREQAAVRDAALRIAVATAGRLRDLHQHSLTLLDKMAARPAIRDFHGGDCDAMFAVVDFFPEYADLLLFDTNGRLVCSAEPTGADRRISLASRVRIEALLRAGALRPRTPELFAVGNQWVSVVSVPVRRSDGTPGGTLALVDLPEIVGREVLPPNTVVAIIDRDGNLLARVGGAQALRGQPARALEFIRLALREKEGTASARGIDGVPRQYGFTELPEAGWIVYVGVPTATVMRPVRDLVITGIEAGAVILCAVALVALMLSRAIQRPIDALANAAESVARGDRGDYAQVESAGGPRELVRLADSFNAMVESRSTLSDRLMHIQEEERRRFAREIHDDLGQSLTALKMDIIGLMSRSEPPLGNAAIRERIIRTIDATVTAVQRIAAELRPSVLDDLGLIAAIEAEAHLFETRSGIECELSLPDEAIRLDATQATVVYRIVQEALTNVARHAGASRVEVRFRQREHDTIVEVRDDGRGITAEEEKAAGSLGLIGMRERAAIVGGSVRIEGIAGRGTIMSVRIPLTA